jgi:WD40 repeat protein
MSYRPPTVTATTGTPSDLSGDFTLSSPPEDSISSLCWSSKANYLAVGSWDSKVRIYDVTASSTGTGVAAIDFEGPVLTCDWSPVRALFSCSSRLTTNSYLGWTEGRRRRHRQSCETPRPCRKRLPRAAGSCSRCPDPIYSLLRNAWGECTYASNRLLG